MKSHVRVAVIGGGVVGASVLYHLAKLGWSDVMLIERKELTAGSTWHAAAGFHALNADPNIAALQGYTIKLYKELQAEGLQDLGLHMTGGVNMAGTPERWEWLKAAWALFKTMGMESELVGPEEVKKICPIADVSGVYGGSTTPTKAISTTTARPRPMPAAPASGGPRSSSTTACSSCIPDPTAAGTSSPSREPSRPSMW